jgi:NAD dependent epimerase/dehydratase family enzyme
MDDLVDAIYHALLTDGLSGPLNATAPQPVTNAQFVATLGRVLGRPAAVPVPAAALRLAFGEMAETALLGGARVLPERLLATGFLFRYPELESALRHLLGRTGPST